MLLSRAHCPLCERVRVPLAGLAPARGWRLRELDVDAHPDLRAEFSDRVPVLLSGDLVIAEGRFDPEAALARAALPDH